MEFVPLGKAGLVTAESKAGPLGTHKTEEDEAAEAGLAETPEMDPFQPNYFPMKVRADSAADSRGMEPRLPNYFPMATRPHFVEGPVELNADAPHALDGEAARAGVQLELTVARERVARKEESPRMAPCQPNYFLIMAMRVEPRLEAAKTCCRNSQVQSNSFLFAGARAAARARWEGAKVRQRESEVPFSGRNGCKMRRGPDSGFRRFRNTFQPLPTANKRDTTKHHLARQPS
jgi:hypothetical protein